MVTSVSELSGEGTAGKFFSCLLQTSWPGLMQEADRQRRLHCSLP